MSLVEQPTNRPTNKLTAATGASAFLGFIFAMLKWAGVEVPTEVIATATPFVTFVAGWLVKDRAVR